MSTATHTGLTEQEFLRLHGGETQVDLVAGQVVRYPMPGGPHGYIGNKAAFILTRFVLEHDLGRVFNCDTFIRTKSDPVTLRGADVAYLSYERLPKGPIPEGPLPVAPELVIEVRLPSDRLSAVAVVAVKVEEFLEAGVRVVVYLDPKNELAAIYQGDELPRRLQNGDELMFPDILPAFSVPVRTFFE